MATSKATEKKIAKAAGQITCDELKRLLRYDEKTGVFYRIISTSNSCSVGDVAGGVRKDGYVSISIKNRKMLAHRLAWLYVHGEFPKYVIDHINGNQSDNMIENLRSTTNQENQRNQKISKRNKTGVTGVRWDDSRKKWQPQITINGKPKYLGLFDDFIDACNARIVAEVNEKFHVNHGRPS